MEAAAASAHSTGGGLVLETRSALEDFLAALPPPGSRRPCAIDTEADSLHSFREKLCLIQFSCAGEHAIIDPLKIKDLGPLLDFLKDSEVWMHGADFDMSLFKRTFDFVPPRVLDTQVAARLCGCRQFGLAHLVNELFGVSLSKQSQRANWGRRPLAPQMIDYALNDVRYVLPLADQLTTRLREMNRIDWFEQSCRAARDAVLQRQPPDTEEAWRITGWGNLQPRGLAALRAIWQWRHLEAERLDRPAFKVLNSEALLDLATKFQAGGLPELPARFPHPVRRRFHQTLETVRKMTPDQWPRRRLSRRAPRVPEAEPRFDHLKAHRDRVANALGLESALIASRGVMEEIAQDASAALQLLPWQLGLMDDALKALDAVPQRTDHRRARRSGDNGKEAPVAEG
jgi:ribonuclease D